MFLPLPFTFWKGLASGPTLLYGPDDFIVGADTRLRLYNAQWTTPPGAIPLGDVWVIAATHDLRDILVADSSTGIWNGPGTTAVVDQRITGTIFSGLNGAFPALMCRCDAQRFEAYVCQWAPSLGVITLYRVTANGFTNIATGGIVAASTTYPGAYLKATGTNPVVIEAGDNINGPAAILFSDANAARKQTGQPGVDIFDNNPQVGSITHLSIYNG